MRVIVGGLGVVGMVVVLNVLRRALRSGMVLNRSGWVYRDVQTWQYRFAVAAYVVLIAVSAWMAVVAWVGN